MIIDAHTHVGPFLEDNGKTADDLIVSMDQAKIDTALVIASNFGPKKQGLNIEELIKIAKSQPRLKIVGNIDYSTLDTEQITKLKKLLENKEIVGIKSYLGYEPYFAYDKKLFPLYEFCEQKNFPIIYHAGLILEGANGLLKHSHPLTIDEVASRFPKLKIVIAHIGNPWILDCAAVVARNTNVYADLSGQFTELQAISKKDKTDFLKNISIFTTIASLDKCLFGSDWWFYSQQECLEAILDIPMTAAEKEAVLWKNAKNIFNL